jgi:hypothetical protein
MYFKIFGMSFNLDNQLTKAGFQANTYEEVSSYVFANNQVEKSIDKISVPKDYRYNGSLWREIELPCYDRYFCLARQPNLNFDQLWELYITTSEKDDEIGSSSVILNNYNKELLGVVSDLLNNPHTVSRQVRKKLKKIGDLLKLTDESIYTKQILSALGKII